MNLAKRVERGREKLQIKERVDRMIRKMKTTQIKGPMRQLEMLLNKPMVKVQIKTLEIVRTRQILREVGTRRTRTKAKRRFSSATDFLEVCKNQSPWKYPQMHCKHI